MLLLLLLLKQPQQLLRNVSLISYNCPSKDGLLYTI
nr:MAG TPA: hypothetical protein [Caudoviricetes sp.]